MTTAATKLGGWWGLGRPYSPGSARRTRARRGPQRGRCFSPPPAPALCLRAPRPGLGLPLALAAALAGWGWGCAREETEPRASPACRPAPSSPSLSPLRGSSAAARSAPAPSAPRLLGAEATRQQCLRRFLRSGDRGQDLEACKDREEKSYRSVTRLILTT